MIVKRTSNGDLVIFVRSSSMGESVERLLSTFDGWKEARAEDYATLRQELRREGAITAATWIPGLGDEK